VDVVIEMLANANLETDLELCHLNSRIAVSNSFKYCLMFPVCCTIFKISMNFTNIYGFQYEKYV